MGFLARERFCDMDAQPNSVGWLAHLTDDEILDRFDRIWKSLFHYSEQWGFRSRCSRVPRSGSRSNRNLYALVGFRLNLIAYRAKKKEKVFAWAHHLMQNRCEKDKKYGGRGDFELSKTSRKGRSESLKRSFWKECGEQLFPKTVICLS